MSGLTITAPSPTTLRLVQPAHYLTTLILGVAFLIPLLFFIYIFIRHPNWKPFFMIVLLGFFVLMLLPPDNTDNVAIVDGQNHVIRVEEVSKGSIKTERDIKFSDIHQVTIQYNRGATRVALVLSDGSVVLPLGSGYVQNEPMHFRAQALIEDALRTGHAHT